MGRVSTSVLVGGVAMLAVAATVDALQRGDDGVRPVAADERRAPAREPWQRAVARELREDGVRGTLVWTDRRCRVHTVRLPDLKPVEPVRRGACRVREVEAPGGEEVARCRDGAVEVVRTESGAVDARFPGCSPAWRPDAALTYVHRGELVADPLCGPKLPCAEVILSRRDLLRAFGDPPWGLRRPALSEVAWLNADSFGAIVRDEERGQELIAVFRGRRLVDAPLFTYDDLAKIRVSPYGTYVAATSRAGRGTGIVVLDSKGTLQGSGLRGGRIVAWSPDETWTAIARPDGVYIFETASRPIRLIRLPVRATDLSWR